MPIKTVSVTYGRKVNLGDFNSLNAECTIWYDLADSEPEDDLMHSLWQMARQNVKEQVQRVAGNGKNTNVTQMFLGLPIEEEHNADQGTD